MHAMPVRVVLTLVLGLVLSLHPASTHAATPPDPQALLRYAETALRDWQVPGAAIVVVKDDKVVLMRGIGVREVGRSETVDADTLFPIASLTKGFTATLAAVEVAAGRLAWDRRVVDLLPGFSVVDPWVTRELRLDDLLTHRTGWQGEVDFLWMEGLARDAILARLPEVKQGDPGFRAGYSYLNVPYLVAGEAMTRASGKSYTALLRDRVLEPLAMSATRVSASEVEAVANRIAPHSDLDGEPRAIALEDGDAVAPAAALHSTPTDMARWLRFHLGDGSLDGRRLLSAEQLAELHEPQTLIPRGAFHRKLYPSSHFQAYARGWVVQDYQGRGVVWNTGGLYGAACSIALVPEEELGVAVLTNGPRISLPEALVFRVLDAWLGASERDWSAERLELSRAGRARAAAAEKAKTEQADEAATARLPLAGYAATYRAPLLGDLTVSAADGKLRVALGALTGSATHWRNDGFLVAWDNRSYGSNLLTFSLDADARSDRAVLEEIGNFDRVVAP